VPLDKSRLRKSATKLRTLLKKRKSMSPEKVHDFRTHARRFEATVEALGLKSRGNEERLLRDLAQLRKLAGRGARHGRVYRVCVNGAR
jgi:hypothetical protein